MYSYLKPRQIQWNMNLRLESKTHYRTQQVLLLLLHLVVSIDSEQGSISSSFRLGQGHGFSPKPSKVILSISEAYFMHAN